MTIPHPEGKETAAILGGWSFVIPKDAKNPDEAKKFVQFLSRAENQGFFTDTFPARISAMKLPRFDDPILERLQGDAAVRPAGAGAQELGADRAGLFRRHPAHPARRRGPCRRPWTRPPRRSRRCSTIAARRRRPARPPGRTSPESGAHAVRSNGSPLRAAGADRARDADRLSDRLHRAAQRHRRPGRSSSACRTSPTCCAPRVTPQALLEHALVGRRLDRLPGAARRRGGDPAQPELPRPRRSCARSRSSPG